MNDTQTQIERLIELAIVQRSELKQLVSELPQLREHLNAEIERTFEETEPQIRTELEEFCRARATDEHAKTGAALAAKVEQLSKQLEVTTAAKYSVLMAERAENATLLANAEARIADAAQAIPSQVKAIVSDELSRFPRAGEIDQLRKEFAEPRGLNPRGRWQIGETYNKLDLVSYNGDSYVSNTDGNREKPSRSSEAWTLSAARGNGGGGGGATSLTDLVPVPANGELLIGNGSAFVNNTLTAGTGVTITNGPGSITIDASGAQELLTATVTNAESFAITRGQVVYLFGATGNRASVKLADNSSDAASSKTFGVVSDASIAANGVGLITCMGVVDGLSLGAYSAGDVLYLGNTPGSVTVTKPYAPNHLVYVGMVERANNGNGELYVRIQNGYELDEIHDVQITSAPLAGSLLMRDATNSLWKANRLTGTANQVTVTNADTAVTLSLPTAIANVNSVTAQSATDLTLAGGSSGASLVLGQGSGASMSSASKLNLSNTTSASSSIAGALTIGNGTPSTNVAIGGGNINAGGTGTFAGAVTTNGTLTTGASGGSDGGLNLKRASDGLTVGSLTANTASSLLSLATAYSFITFATEGVERGRFTNGNLLIGTTDTTGLTGLGGLKIASSTAGSASAGALVVTGGLSAGNNGNASYFGGAVTAGVAGTSTHTLNGVDRVLTLVSSTTNDNSLLRFKGGATDKYTVGFNSGKLIFYSDIGSAYLGQWDTTSLTITGALSTTGAATFAGAVTVGGNVGFYNNAPVAKPTGVAVTAAAIHAALVTLNLIAA